MAKNKSLTTHDYVHYATGNDLQDLIDRLAELGGNTLQMADNLLANIAAKARRKAKDREGGAGLRMGGSYAQRWQVSTKSGKGSWVYNRGSKWSQKTGSYVSRTKTTGNGPWRLVNFNFETVAWKRRYGKNLASMRRGLSKVSLTSQVANLWEFPAHYSKASGSKFSSDGISFGGWPKGTRAARPFFYSGYGQAVESAMPEAIQEAKSELVWKWRR